MTAAAALNLAEYATVMLVLALFALTGWWLA